MAFLSSSSPAAVDYASRRLPPPQNRLFAHTSLLTVPSSPTSAYQDGEISPTFDSSFTSSMSLSNDHPRALNFSVERTTTNRRPPVNFVDAPRLEADSRVSRSGPAKNSGRHLKKDSNSLTSPSSSTVQPEEEGVDGLDRSSLNDDNNQNQDDVSTSRWATENIIQQKSSTVDLSNSISHSTTGSNERITSSISTPPLEMMGDHSAMDISPNVAFSASSSLDAATRLNLSTSSGFPFLARASSLALFPPKYDRTDSTSSVLSNSSSATSSSSSTTTTKASEIISSASSSTVDFPLLKNLFSRQPRPSLSNTSSSSSSSSSSSKTKDVSYGAWFVASQPAVLEISETLESTAPLSIRPRSSAQNSSAVSSRPAPRHFATVPPSNAEKLLPPFQDFHIDESPSDDGQADTEDEEEGAGSMPPPRVPISSMHRKAFNWTESISRPLSANDGLKPPPHLSPVKRASDPNLSSRHSYGSAMLESSPFRMDVDGTSPASSPVASIRPRNHPRSVSDSAGRNPFQSSQRVTNENSPPRPDVEVITSDSGASSRLGDLFADDLSPIPPSRKRFLSDDRDFSPDPTSPSPAICGTSSLFNIVPPRRPFEKAMSTTAIPLHVARRQRSSANLGLKKRPSLSTFNSMGPPPSSGPASAGLEPPAPLASIPSAGFKRHAVTATDGKPKSMRRALSVADATIQLQKQRPNAPDTSYRASIATETRDFADVGRLAAAPRAVNRDGGISTSSNVPPESGSPVAGFRRQEMSGKVLPCHPVKDDGLMRITPETLRDLQAGAFSSRIKRYIIIDCRFPYEFSAGHIKGAQNIPERTDVERLLLHNSPPEPSTSECAPAEGKTILVFHCEYSRMRAPDFAAYLRTQDRLKNCQAYPNIHYPEVYVLSGGYEGFHQAFPDRCFGGYRRMDDPAFKDECKLSMRQFEQPKRQFQRANTFTFGQGQVTSDMLQAVTSRPPLQPSQSHNIRGSLDETFSFPATKSSNLEVPMSMDRPTTRATPKGNMSACHEDEQDGDSSFDTASGSSPSGGGDSPCPGGKIGRNSLSFGRKSKTELAPPFRPGTKQPFSLGAGGTGRRVLERAQTSTAAFMFKR